MAGPTRFKCRICGKVTAGRVPRRGDGSLVYPRKHAPPLGPLAPGRYVTLPGRLVEVRGPDFYSFGREEIAYCSGISEPAIWVGSDGTERDFDNPNDEYM